MIKKSEDGNKSAASGKSKSESDAEKNPKTMKKEQTLEEVCEDLEKLQIQNDLKAIDIKLTEPDTEENRRRIAGLRNLSERIGRFRAENCP